MDSAPLRLQWRDDRRVAVFRGNGGRRLRRETCLQSPRDTLHQYLAVSFAGGHMQMNEIARALSDADLGALTTYYSGEPPATRRKSSRAVRYLP